jgi:Fe2+ transport system protein FeoA
MSMQLTEKTLPDVPIGSKCVVSSIHKKATVAKRLIEMGIGKGVELEVIRVAPLGDPIEVKVKGYLLSIRKEEAVNIAVAER